MIEQTVVLLKPDTIKRALVGEVIARLEKAGLKLVAMKMVWVTKDHVAKHYTDNEDFLRAMGNKTLETYEKYGKDANEEMGTADSLEIGKMVREWNMEFMSSGPVVAMVWEGLHAVEVVRKLVGSTMPAFAEPGSIRGTYSVDSPALANEKKRAVRNMIHASGEVEEAKMEIQLWFREDEIYAYKRADEDAMYE